MLRNGYGIEGVIVGDNRCTEPYFVKAPWAIFPVFQVIEHWPM